MTTATDARIPTADHGMMNTPDQDEYSEESAPSQTGNQYRQYEIVLGVTTMALQRKAIGCSRPVIRAMTADIAATTKKPDVQDSDSMSSRISNQVAAGGLRRITHEFSGARSASAGTNC